MTIEQLKSEKAVLKAKIEKAVEEFCDATGFTVQGKFKTVAKQEKDKYGFPTERFVAAPSVTIEPIQI